MEVNGVRDKPRRGSRIAARVRNLSMILLFLVLVLIIALAAVFVTDVTNRASKDLAFFYSLEAVNIFSMYTSQDLALVQKVATSKAVTEWFSDESDPEKRAAAFIEMMDYKSLFSNAELYFVINDSLNEFSITSMSFADFVPFNTLSPDVPYDSWYFNLASSDKPYDLHIDLDKVSNEWRMWINHKVMYHNELVGVFCSGLKMDALVDLMFARHNENNVEGFVIDSQGLIQMRSGHTEYTEAAQPVYIYSIIDDPSFDKYMNLYLDGIDGYFTTDAHPEVIVLSKGQYGYASIAPLINTDWMVVTFYVGDSLFAASTLLPLVIVLVSVFILHALASGAITRRFVLKPLHSLTASVSEAQDNETAIYGEEREDEIGELAQTIKGGWGRINEAHRRARLMLDATPLACRLMRRLDAEVFEVFECNEEAVKLFNFKDKREFMERYFETYPEYQPDGRNSIEAGQKSLEKAYTEGKNTTEFLFQAADGTLIPTEVTLVRVEYGDEYVIAGYARDLREQIQMMEDIHDSSVKLEAALNEMQKASSAKSDFLANMSHEMRTPLNAIIGLSGLSLENDEVDKKTFFNLEKINNSGNMLLSIVNDILDISKIEAGKMDLVDLEYDVPGLINDTVTQNILRIGEKPVEMILAIGEDVFSRLRGDEVRIKQIMNNLLSNAIKYTDEGSIELGLRCERDGDRVWVTITVSDTGKGIRPEDLDKLFKDYSQLDLESNQKKEGTGLGLPITKNLAEMMDGSVEVGSVYGKGSVFTVKISQGFVTGKHIDREVIQSLRGFRYSDVKRGKDAKFKRVSLPNARVLVVDDNLTNLDVAKGLMKPYGMQIDCVTDGQQAVRALRDEKNRYDAVFMDHMMPGMDGIEATRKIRDEIGTEYAKTVPIIALTANAISGNEAMFLNNGFQAYISKPIDISGLDTIIREWIGDKVREESIEPPEKDIADSAVPLVLDIDKDVLDAEKGIARFGGNEETYLAVLRSFVVNTVPLLDSIGEVSEDTMAGYAVVVHGIKGSGRGVCADKLANAAEIMEKAAKAGDYDFVSSNNPSFLESAARMLEEIGGALARISPDRQKPSKARPDENLLKKLLEACKSYDTDEIDNLISELDSYEYDSGGDLISGLVTSANHYNYKEMREKLISIIERQEV